MSDSLADVQIANLAKKTAFIIVDHLSLCWNDSVRSVFLSSAPMRASSQGNFIAVRRKIANPAIELFGRYREMSCGTLVPTAFGRA